MPIGTSQREHSWALGVDSWRHTSGGKVKSMMILRWLCIGLGIGLVGSAWLSGPASAARALSGAGSAPGAPAAQRPSAPLPDGQMTQTRIAAVVNDEAI